jgi:transketolase
MGTYHKLDNLCGIIDVNRLGQSRPTMWQHDMEAMAGRWQAFGWHAIVVNGHDIGALLDAFAAARSTKGRPTMILARTLKGKGISFVEDKDGWHGKPLKKGEEADRALAELEAQYVDVAPNAIQELVAAIPKPEAATDVTPPKPDVPPPDYKLGDLVATREAYGTAIARLGKLDDRIVALDADVKNSTFSDRFEKQFPDRFYQCFIAEQGMVGAAMGLASRGAIPFPSTFACFLSRAYDFIRMAAISGVAVKLAGSHAGVSIGEDGPSQMALEDLAMMTAEPNFTVLYPCDAVSAERLVELAAYHEGPAYIRTSRPKTPVIYESGESFRVGGSKVLRQSASDSVTVVAAGVTVFEALKAYDQLRSEGTFIRVIDAYSVQPIDADTLIAAGRQSRGRFITVEDHYLSGGLGDAVADAVAPAGFTVRRLGVTEIPRSGKPEELLERYGISASRIVAAVKAG